MKRQKSRKLFSLLLAAVMLFCALPATHAAAPDRSVTLTAGDETADGLVPLVIAAHNYIGLKGFDLRVTPCDDVSIADIIESSPDLVEMKKTNNSLLLSANPLNGKIVGFFEKDSLWTLDEFQANLKKGQVLSDSFDPNHIVLCVVYIHFGPETENTSAVTLEGSMNFGGEEKDIINKTIQVPHSTSGETFYVRYDNDGEWNSKDFPEPQTKTKGVDLTISTQIPKATFVILFIINDGGIGAYATKNVDAEFSNWYSKKDGRVTIFNPGDVYTADEDLVLSPQWTARIGEMPVPEKEGYTFVGWFTKLDREAYTEDSAIHDYYFTLYAHWEAKRGDVNGSNDVTAADARAVLRRAVELETFDAEQMILADMDGDATVTAADARAVLRTAVKLDALRYVEYRAEDHEPQV